MYQLIENHMAEWIALIDRGQVIQPYVDLQDSMHEVDVSQDTDFQQSFRHYYKMNQALLCNEYLAEYFGYLQYLKDQPVLPQIQDVVTHLYQFPTHNNGRHSLQFSFATKLLHTLNPVLPIYDALVADFYFFPKTVTGDFNARLASLVENYTFLDQEYDRILTQGLLAQSIADFRANFDLRADYTDIKIIDTIIWRFSTWLRAGAIRDGLVQYE